MEPRRYIWWYDTLIDWMLANPGGSFEQAATDLGRSAVWLRIVSNSDTFRARYQARRAELSDNVKNRLTDKLTKVAEMSLDCIVKRLEDKQSKVPLPVLVDLQDRTLQRLGYGAEEGNSPMVQNNTQIIVNSIDRETLVDARNRLRAVEELRRIEHPPGEPVAQVDVPPSLGCEDVDGATSVEQPGGGPADVGSGDKGKRPSSILDEL